MRRHLYLTKKKLLCLIFIAFNLGCDADLDLNIPDYEKKIVVEGWIEAGRNPIVILSWSAPFFSEIDSASIRKLVLTSATVEISDGNRTEFLTLRPNTNYFPPYIYQGNRMIGEIGETYDLKVKYREHLLTAQTYIPQKTGIDTFDLQADKQTDTTAFINITFADRALEKNYYRILTKRLNKDVNFFTPLVSLFDDQFFNGEQLHLKIYGGSANFKASEESLHYSVNDTVILKFCCINEESMNFWVSLNNELVNGNNPLSATNRKIVSNINGGLGIWEGIASSYYKIYINDKKK